MSTKPTNSIPWPPPPSSIPRSSSLDSWDRLQGPDIEEDSVDASAQVAQRTLGGPKGTIVNLEEMDPAQADPDDLSPLQIFINGKRIPVPIKDPNDRANLDRLNTRFESLFRDKLGVRADQNVTYDYQFSYTRVIYKIDGQPQEPMKIDLTDRSDLSKCIKQLEALYVKIRGEDISYYSYCPESLTLAGASPRYTQVQSSALLELQKKKFADGYELAKQLYIKDKNIQGTDANLDRLEESLDRLNDHKLHIGTQIGALSSSASDDDKKKLAVLRALKNQLDSLDGYQFAKVILADVSDPSYDALKGQIDGMKRDLSNYCKNEEEDNASSPKKLWRKAFGKPGDLTKREEIRKKDIDQYVNYTGSLVFARAFCNKIEEGRVQHDRYCSKNALQPQYGVAELLIPVFTGEVNDPAKRLATALKHVENDLSDAEAEELAQLLL